MKLGYISPSFAKGSTLYHIFCKLVHVYLVVIKHPYYFRGYKLITQLSVSSMLMLRHMQEYIL